MTVNVVSTTVISYSRLIGIHRYFTSLPLAESINVSHNLSHIVDSQVLIYVQSHAY